MAQYTPVEAWNQLTDLKARFYSGYAAEYSGQTSELARTSEPGAFWARSGKSKLHVPIAADIAATSSDLLFSEEPTFTITHEGTDETELPQQKRLDEMISKNHLDALLNEAAETAAVLGDVYLKLNWRSDVAHPILTITQADCAYPEYTLGLLDCIHFFSVLKYNRDTDEVWRVYELYERGRITTAIYKGSAETLGMKLEDAALQTIGLEPENRVPVNDMLAVHIPNIRPNRDDRYTMRGRSDLAGLRGLMDALDEAYTSWLRDIRLAKAKLIVPAEYLRKQPNFDEAGGNGFTYEFDEDVETLVALNMDPDHPGETITASQFAIRSTEHAATCEALIRQIVTIAGYAPQTFGIGIEGNAQSGTALHIREKKSFNTQGKKQTYWKDPLTQILTSMVHIDAVLNPGAGSHVDDKVAVAFAEQAANDITTMSGAIEMLSRAEALSTRIKVQMLHPDWNERQLTEEIERIQRENGTLVESPDMGLGDYERPTGNE